VLFAEAADDFFTYAQYLRIVAGLLLLFAATAGPELLCPDRRQNVLALIFTRPVTRSDYLLAKLAALLAVVGLIALVPLVVLFVGNTLTADSAATYLRQNLDDLGRILLAGLKHFAPVEGFISDLVVFKQLTIAGGAGFTPSSMRSAVDLLTSDRVDRSVMVGDVVTLDDLDPIVEAFEDGFIIETGERTPSREYVAWLREVPGMDDAVARLGSFDVTDGAEEPAVVASAVEFLLEGLHLARRLNKERVVGGTIYHR